MKIRRLGEIKCKVGEGPVWDVREQALYFVDIRAQHVHRYDPSRESFRTWEMPQQIGCLALREEGGAVVALQDGFYAFDFESGQVSPLARPLNDASQFNDGKTDREGRFLAGTASGFDKPPAASIYSLGPDATLTQIETGMSISNGPCFSPDGRTFYFTDSAQSKVFAYDYAIDGTLSNRRVFIDGFDWEGGMDGATVDAAGNYYITNAFQGRIRRFDPSGKENLVIETPVPWPSSVMFGGTNLDCLYFTSIDGTVYDMATTPESGGLYVVEGLDAKGIEERRYVG